MKWTMDGVLIFLSTKEALFPIQQTECLEWDSFRHPRYFITRLNDCCERFKRIIGTFSDAFQNEAHLEEIERQKEILIKQQPRCVIISNEPGSLVPEMIKKQRVQQQTTGAVGITLVLCHIQLSNLDKWKEIFLLRYSPFDIDTIMEHNSRVLKDKILKSGMVLATYVKELLNVMSLLQKEKAMFSMVIAYDITEDQDCEATGSEIHTYIADQVGSHTSCTGRWHPRVVMGIEETTLVGELEKALEDIVLTVFDDMYSYIDRFLIPSHMPYDCTKHKIKDSTRSSHVSSSETETPGTSADTFQGSEGKLQQAGISSQEHVTFHPLLEGPVVETMITGFFCPDNYKILVQMDLTDDNVLSVIADRLRCVLVPTLALQYRLIYWMCNQIFHELKFSERVVKAASKETRLEINEVLEKYKEAKSVDSSAINTMFRHVKKDIGPVLDFLAKILGRAEGFIDVMKRFQHEIRGYFSQSLTRKYVLEPIPVLSTDFKNDIVRIPEVFGIGTVFGECEVHVTADPIDFDKVKDNINRVAAKHSVCFPLRFKQVRVMTYTKNYDDLDRIRLEAHAQKSTRNKSQSRS